MLISPINGDDVMPLSEREREKRTANTAINTALKMPRSR